ncbi:hypothetical protein [Duganella sp. S19_KUP01_CR8]
MTVRTGASGVATLRAKVWVPACGVSNHMSRPDQASGCALSASSLPC